MTITIDPATYEEKSTIRNLMQLYIYDFSEFTGWRVNDTGLFNDFRYIDHYWTEEGRFPFLVRVDGALAGFAFVRQVDGTSHVSEFFVMRAYRQGGVGREVARLLFDRFPGPWMLDVMPQNTPALAFWRRVVIEAGGATAVDSIDEDSGRTVWTFTVAEPPSTG